MKKILSLIAIAIMSLTLLACDMTSSTSKKTNTSSENIASGTTIVTSGNNGTSANSNTTIGNTTAGASTTVTTQNVTTIAPITSSITKTEITTIDNSNVKIKYVSGTEDAYKIEGTTITFSSITADSAYQISGEFHGNIVIDASDFKFELELNGLKLVSDTVCPIAIISGDEVKISAKKGSTNEITDYRDTVDTDNSEDYGSTIYSVVDLAVQGKGELTIVSENNDGIHTKDDLELKNLTLSISCIDNCLKGNDSVTIESGTYNLIAKQGDTIKCSNSDISSKGNQRGNVTISGGTLNLYAACDGIDAAYNAIIDESSSTVVLNIFTDKYSEYSEEITDVSTDSYIRTTTNSYSYSIKFFNSDTDYVWKDATYYTSQQSGGGRPGQSRTTYYYYKVERPSGYSKFTVYAYTSSQNQGQDSTYYQKSDSKSVNETYDTLALSMSSSSMSVSFTNYQTTQPGGMGPGGMGPGGMNDGNTDKGDHSTKGIKASNEIIISGGTIYIKSYDDAIHANNDNELENGQTPLGNVTISGGNLTLYSNDDGIHADGITSISGGSINITNSYEGVEGTQIVVSGGYTRVVSKDDGFNATATSGIGMTLSGGTIYVYAGGDGLDSNSKTQYKGIIFSGSNVIVVSTSSNNSSIDTEQGYTYESGMVLAICPSNGMGSESKNCSNFSSIGKYQTLSLTKDSYVTVSVSGSETLSLKMPCSLSSLAIYLGSSSATISQSSQSSLTYDSYGVYTK